MGLLRKKAEIPIGGAEIIRYTIILFLIPIAVVFLTISSSYAKTVSDTTSPKIEMSILEYRFFNSPECFAYQDPYTNRVYPEIIDLDKFTDEQFLNCYFVAKDSDKRCFSLELEYDKTSKTIYTNNWVKCKVGQRTIAETKAVLVEDNGEFKRAKLLIHKEKYL